MVLILLVAAALRLAAPGEVPPGLYHDEAYNGLDALRVLEGDLSLYFSANNGREPIFIYLVALTVGLLGRSPLAVRLAALAPGLLTVAATYAAARGLFNRRVGWLSAAVLSVTLWHVHLSRVGFRAVLLPLFIALTVWQGALAGRTGRRRYWLAAGVLYGLSFYTYNAARFTPLALLLFGLYYLLRHRPSRPTKRASRITHHIILSLSKDASRLRWAVLGFAVAIAPLALFTLLHTDLVLGRTGQVSIWNPAIHGGDFWGTLLKHTTRTLGMFFVRGDRIWRHNLPGRPIFDPLLGLFFLLGLVRALRNFRRDPASALVVIWTATLALPTLLAEDAPHFLRAVGVLPLAAILPALGLDWATRITDRVLRDTHHASRVTHHIILSLSKDASRLVPLLVLPVALWSTVTAYFGDYAHADLAAYWFEAGAETLAGRVNGFLSRGWEGERMLHGRPDGRRAYVDPSLWETWTALPFLVTPSPAARVLPPGENWPTVGNGPAAIFVWPYGDWQRVWGMLDPAAGPAEVRVQAGPLSQGDRDPEPFTTYRAFYVTPVEAVPPPLARFTGVALVGAELERSDQGVRVTLRWHSQVDFTDDYTVFAHYVRDGARIGQGDARPAGGYYPTDRWRAGDLVHDEHAIPLPGPPDPARDQLFLGFYRPEDGRRLDLLDSAGNPVGTHLALPIDALGASP